MHSPPQPAVASQDYLAYREWLGEAIKATGCLLHAHV
jgi:hypothetical protein